METEEERVKRLKQEREKGEEQRRQYIESLKTAERPQGPWEYITAEQLQVLVWTKPTDQLVRDFGISGNAIAKRCRKLGLQKPPRGFWAQVEAGKRPHPKGVPVKFKRGKN